jgi:SAM-dependent methyltransferase
MTLARMRVAEWMDDPALRPGDHDAALEGLARLNALSFCHRALWPSVRTLAARNGDSLHVLDVASGGGDLPIRMDAVARRHGVRLRWTLTDRSAHALRHGLARARAAGLSCEGAEVDVLGQPLPTADLVINSLFLHHFDGPDVIRILGAMRHAARLAVGVSDLRRTRLALGLVWLGSRMLTRSPVVHHDATASVRAAHQPQEMRTLADRAGLRHAAVQVADPVRWRLWWERGVAA